MSPSHFLYRNSLWGSTLILRGSCLRFENRWAFPRLCWQGLLALPGVQGEGEGAQGENKFELLALLCQRLAEVHALGFQGRVLSWCFIHSRKLLLNYENEGVDHLNWHVISVSGKGCLVFSDVRFHCWSNCGSHRKPSFPMVAGPRNHWKTNDLNGWSILFH